MANDYTLVADKVPPYDRRVLLSLVPRDNTAVSIISKFGTNIVAVGRLVSTDVSGHRWSYELVGPFANIQCHYEPIAWRDLPEPYCLPGELAKPVELGEDEYV